MKVLSAIQGIGLIYIVRLEIIQIYTTNDLLSRAGDKENRELIAEEIWVNEDDLYNWVRQADLYRIRGLKKQYLAALNACGIKTVQDLSISDPETLFCKMQNMNGMDRIQRIKPNIELCQNWVEQSKQLPQVIC